MPGARSFLGRTFLALHALSRRARGKAFSVLAAGGFASFGRNSVLTPPLRLEGAGRIAVGDGVFLGEGCWLHVEGPQEGPVAIEIGDGTCIVGHCVLSAADSVRLGRRVLIARGAYLGDHSHRFDDPRIPVLDQGIDRIAPIVVEDGAWLGENVVICPGVRVGAGAVIGANSVVTRDVPPGAVVAGAPATVLRQREASPSHSLAS